MDLRPYQAEAVEHILDYALEHPTGRLLVVCPPGGGKTLIVATVLRLMIAENGLLGMIVAHRHEMIDHHYKHLLEAGLTNDMLGVLMGADNRSNSAAPIQIASIDTLNRRRMKPSAQLLVTDEAHRDASRCRRILRSLYPQAFQLGVTATPARLDGKGLREDFDDMIVVSSISELVVDGYLASPKVFTVPKDRLPDVRRIQTRGGEFEVEELEKVVNQRVLIGEIVAHWKRIAKNRRTIAFAATIAHSKHITESFRAAGIPSAHLDQNASPTQRKQILADLELGTLRVVSCVNILSEGWDCPPCKCVILARPTKSLNLHLQQCGRCMRPWESVIPILLDHAGNVVVHGLPQMDREWSLEAPTVASAGHAPVKVCPHCMAVVHAGVHQCPECGESFGQPSPILEEAPGQLVMHQLDDLERKSEWDRIVRFAERKGFPESWAKRVLHAKYG